MWCELLNVETDDFSRAKFGLRDELSRHCTLVVWVWGFVNLWPISFGWHPPSPHLLSNMTLHCQTDDAFSPSFSPLFFVFFWKRQPDRPIRQPKNEFWPTDAYVMMFKYSLCLCRHFITASSPWPAHGRVGLKSHLRYFKGEKTQLFVLPMYWVFGLYAKNNNPISANIFMVLF